MQRVIASGSICMEAGGMMRVIVVCYEEERLRWFMVRCDDVVNFL